MDFTINNEQVFVKTTATAKFLAGYQKTSSFLESLHKNVEQHAILEGMYRVNLETSFFDVYCHGFATIEVATLSGQFSQHHYDHWLQQPCLLKTNLFTRSGSKKKLEIGTAITPLSEEGYPRNGNYIGYSYCNLSAIAEFCDDVGLKLGSQHLDIFCRSAVKEQVYLSEEYITLDRIREDSLIDAFLKCFPYLEENPIDAIISVLQQRTLSEYKAFELKLRDKKNIQKKDNELELCDEENIQKKDNEEGLIIEKPTTNSAWIAIGALIDVLSDFENYKTKSDIKVAIRAKHRKIRGLSSRNLDDILKQGSDALTQAQKSLR